MLLKLSLFAAREVFPRARFPVLEGRSTLFRKVFANLFEKNSVTASKLKLTLFNKKGYNILVRNHLRAKKYHA